MLEDLVEEFANEFANGADLHGTVDRAEDLLNGVLPPDQVADIMSDVRGSSNSSTWEKIASVPALALSQYLLLQHPQVIALTLSKLGTGTAAEIMQLLPRDLRNEATRRLFLIAPVADAALRVIETRLHQDLVLNPPIPAGAGTKRLADIVNKMAPEHIEDLLKSLEAERPEDAEALRAKLFTFDDLVRLPPKTRSDLVRKGRERSHRHRSGGHERRIPGQRAVVADRARTASGRKPNWPVPPIRRPGMSRPRAA